MRDLDKKNEANKAYYHRNKERTLAEQREKYAKNENGIADKARSYVNKKAKADPEAARIKKAAEKERNATRYSLYSRWRNMIIRCTDQTHRDYQNYGGRGIKVIAPLDNFKEYRKYILTLVEKPEDIFDKHIDRIDNDKCYEIGNLRVIGVKENLENSRNVKNNPSLKGGGKNV